MTLSEAIDHCEEKAEKLEKRVKPYQCESINKKLYEVNKKEWDDCLECASEHRQLAKWLRELQIYRQKLTEIEEAVNFYKGCETCQGFREYPTDEFVEDLVRILEVNADADSD